MISVVIPTLNEAARLPCLLDSLAREDADHEVIVVDGGSEDETVAIAARRGSMTIGSRPGRGHQLRAGAAIARGTVILFLHADSIVAPRALSAIAEAFKADPRLIGGNFRLLFDGPSGFSRWLTRFYAWLRRHGVYYGDSGLFVRRDVYDALGGIPPIALMEDYAFVRRLERSGPTRCIDDPPLMTSSRRFTRRRPAAIVLNWLLIHALFHLGVPPDRLAALYDSGRRRSHVTARH
jgi:rSAM/selenodomain-associated transferase 2